MWVETTKYYFEYFLVYSLLMKIGIKSEIHDCTLKVVGFLESRKILPEGTFKLINEDKDLRIDNQYYLKNKRVKINSEELSEFYLRLKEIIESITFEEIQKIRKELF